MRILAVDWGERRVGLAVSDPSGTLASPLATRVVRDTEDALEQVARVASSEEVERVVVGLPLLLSGERGAAALAAESFATRLAERLAIPVETYDERLTSALGERMLREAGTRRKRDKGQLDQSAAVMLLDSFLRRLANRRRDEP
jgi:putative Holliday junction resolvase